MASFSAPFHSEWVQIKLYFRTMYLYCVYPAMSKIPKQLPNCLTRTVLCDISVYTVTVSYHCSTWIRYQKNYQWQYITKIYPVNAGLRLWCLTPLSTIFQLYLGSVLLVEENGVPRENHWPVRSTSRHEQGSNSQL